MSAEDFQWTLILSIIGLLIGLLLPSGLQILGNYDYSQVSKDPINFLTGYVVAVPFAIFTEVFSALIGGLFMGIIGLFVDLFRGISTSSGGFYE